MLDWQTKSDCEIKTKTVIFIDGAANCCLQISQLHIPNQRYVLFSSFNIFLSLNDY